MIVDVTLCENCSKFDTRKCPVQEPFNLAGYCYWSEPKPLDVKSDEEKMREAIATLYDDLMDSVLWMNKDHRYDMDFSDLDMMEKHEAILESLHIKPIRHKSLEEYNLDRLR